MASLAIQPFRSLEPLRKRLRAQLERNKDLEIILAQRKRAKTYKLELEQEKIEARPKNLAELKYLYECNSPMARTMMDLSIFRVLGTRYRTNGHLRNEEETSKIQQVLEREEEMVKQLVSSKQPTSTVHAAPEEQATVLVTPEKQPTRKKTGPRKGACKNEDHRTKIAEGVKAWRKKQAIVASIEGIGDGDTPIKLPLGDKKKGARPAEIRAQIASNVKKTLNAKKALREQGMATLGFENKDVCGRKANPEKVAALSAWMREREGHELMSPSNP